jgi:4-aminobutyrate aminotransferase-like enzyme
MSNISGAEGIENAIKITQHVAGRPATVLFKDAFHGRNLLVQLCCVNLGNATEGLWRTGSQNLTYKRVRNLPGF